jgi:L-serine/L-threonine ammonia-lyase
MQIYLETPLIASAPLAERAGLEQVWLKLESLQPSGSFKNRGLGHFVKTYIDRGANCFVCASGGNAGLAVARSARLCGVPSMIVVPEGTPDIVIERLEREGAEVTIYGQTFADADSLTRQMADEGGCVYTSPYDDPLIWEGNSTMIDEIVAAGPIPDLIILSVGGGGLLCGVLQGLHRHGLTDIPVLAIETAGAPTLARAIETDQVVELEQIDTVAKSLAARHVTSEALAWTKRHRVISQLVTDRQAVDACLAFADDHRMLVEPACGAALAPLYLRHPALAEFNTAAVIVCGGSGVTLALLDEWNRHVT